MTRPRVALAPRGRLAIPSVLAVAVITVSAASCGDSSNRVCEDSSCTCYAEDPEDAAKNEACRDNGIIDQGDECPEGCVAGESVE